MRRPVLACIAVALVHAALPAQSPAPTQVGLVGALPPDARPKQLVASADSRRIYYTDSTGDVWLYDRAAKNGSRIATGRHSDLSLSPAGDALAYTKVGDTPHEHFVWVLGIDPQTGIAKGAERRASTAQGDSPAISPDGKWLAYARDDSTGVGQSVVIVALPPGRAPARVVVPSIGAGVGNIRWTPDARALYFGVNPPVACNPDWSCLPPRTRVLPVGTIRRVDVRGGKVTTVATARSVWPGLSPDGSMIAYADTGRVRRMVVADTSGHRLDSFALQPGQSVEGWLSGSSLVVSTPGNVRRLRAFDIADRRSRILVDSLDGLFVPAWSPDGKNISIVRWAFAPGNFSGEVRIMSAGGSLVRSIPLAEQFITNSWSPDGRWIAVSSWFEKLRISAVEVATGRLVRLDTTSGSVVVRWLASSQGVIATSDSATQVVFRRVDLNGAAHDLAHLARSPSEFGALVLDSSTAIIVRAGEDVKRVALDGSGRDSVIMRRSAGFYSAALSDDNKWLTLRANPRGADAGRMNVLELMHPDGTGRVTIELPFFAAPGYTPFVLPGGGELIVAEAFGQGHDPAVYRVNVATRGAEKLFSVPAGPFYRPDFAISPDGRTLLYVTSEVLPPRLFTMDLSAARSAAPR